MTHSISYAGLQNDTTSKISEAEKVKVTGATGAYHITFEAMENKLEDVKDILKRATISNDEIAGVTNDIDRVNAALRTTTSNLETLDRGLSSTKQEIDHGQSDLDYLRNDADRSVLLT